jgi:acyl carrier protein
MIPSSFIQVDKIPLTPSGKVNKKALLKSEGISLRMSVTYVEPRDDKEKLIANLCKEVFNLDKIGIYDNFFSLGATSFSVIQLNNKLQEIFKKDIPVLTMFEYPTIASFLEYMELEVPVPGDSREEEQWVQSRKQGQNKFRKLRDKRINHEEFENV